MNKLNLAIVGVLFPTKYETKINDAIKSLNTSLYWLSWGNRYATVLKVCNYLYKQGFWDCTLKKNEANEQYFIYSSIKNFRFPLIFFHHDSKNQGGNGKIYYKYEIDKVVISKYNAIPIKTSQINFEPINSISKVWFGISRVCGLERDGIDYRTFHIHSEITGKPERNITAKDAAYLYFQVLPVIEPYHKDNDKTCNCLICR